MKSRQILYLLSIAAILGTAGGCSLFKKSTAPVRVATEDERLIQSVMDNATPGEAIEMRITGKSEMDGEKFSFIGTVRILRNDCIWVSLRSSLGIEVARVLARPDSVWIVSKLMKIKEKGDWKLIREWTGYGLDFNALQGVLTQSLFTANGNRAEVLLNDLRIRRRDQETWIAWKPELEEDPSKNRYLAQFLIESGTNRIHSTAVKDGAGRWVSKATYEYGKDNLVKKIEINGMDESHEYSAEINVITFEKKENLEINFERF